ncbi:uncharacterized protein B0H18DRAFT_1112357 [Fomitopsis serialis]|uniref:uncharacterized protein n=1 Tax=Fomitopsis serialis TaxID=139415 RepID=UPI0020079AA1|nr:uncharacterized protein B0H18DRAFT_1112357 [Neoantrodia serialis]KAH9938176.1 hypothetical protein B0H18DRAFT_1112357 [Neoantrodia serialis]
MSPMQMGMEPLLPPTPPFVMQQFGYRPQSQNSHRDSSQGGGQRRSHSSSPTPPPQHLTAGSGRNRGRRAQVLRRASAEGFVPAKLWWERGARKPLPAAVTIIFAPAGLQSSPSLECRHGPAP